MMATKTEPFHVAEYLDSPEMIAAYLLAALEEQDQATFVQAVGEVTRAAGMTRIARGTGLSREALYRSFGEHGNPTLDTVMKVFQALGLRLTVEAAEQKEFA